MGPVPGNILWGGGGLTPKPQTNTNLGMYASITLRGPVPDEEVLDDMANTLRETVIGAGLEIQGGPLICQILPTVETEVMFQTVNKSGGS